MNLKSLITLSLVLIGFAMSGQARLRYSEFGFGISSLTSSNDIATTTSVSSILIETRPSAKIFAMYHVNDWFGLGGDINYGWIYGEDNNHSNINRDFEYYTTITQTNAFIEVNLIRYGKFHRETKFGLYTRLGVGVLAYNPTLTYNGLLPDNVIPYPDSYTTTNSFGAIGIKLRSTYKSSIRLEAAFYSTGVDNLEGFEYNNNRVDAAKDSYGGFTISYSLLVF